MARLQDRLDRLKDASDDYDAKVKEYMMDHKEAVVALAAGVAGGSVAFDSTNKYSEDAKAMGGFTAGLALAWALQNMEEVKAVSSDLAKASVIEADYTKQMDDLKSTNSEVQAKINALKRD